MNRFFQLSLFISLCFSHILPADIKTIDASSLRSPNIIHVELEYASTEDQMTWGLMGRPKLPLNFGMIFSFDGAQPINIWSFNCLTNIGVSFLDNRGVISEHQLLKAYPDQMDPNRTVSNMQDLQLYPPSDPVRTFFKKRSITSSKPYHYALETNEAWLQEYDLQLGDVLIWEDQQSTAYVSASLPLDKLSKSLQEPLLIRYKDASFRHSFRFLENSSTFLLFLNEEGIVEEMRVGSKGVHISKKPMKGVCLAPSQWVLRKNIKQGTALFDVI